MKRFETSGNYFVVTDTVTEKVEMELPTKDIYYKNSNGTIRFNHIEKHIVAGERTGYPLGLTAATGSVELTGGASGSVDGITVDSVQIMSGAEAFDTDLATTAQNVADNINAFTSTPNYTAEADGDTVNITAVTKGTASNGLVVVSATTTITSTDTNLSGATANIVNSSDTPFADLAALLTFLRANTGA